MRKKLVDVSYKVLAKLHRLKGTGRSTSIANALDNSLLIYKQGRDRYDFHHLSLGALCALFPGAIGRFGRWQVFDSLVNYDPTNVFTKGQRHFVLGEDGSYSVVAGSLYRDEDGTMRPVDGCLYLVSCTSEGRVHPSDNLFVSRMGQLFKECFIPFAKTPILDAADEKDDELLVNAILKVSSNVRGARLADFYSRNK